MEILLVTILVPYGSLFFAAAPVFEEGLPTANLSRHAAVILVLLGRKDVGSTFLGVLERYAETLKSNDSKLLLAEVSMEVRRQLVHTGLIRDIGRENIYMATELYSESLLEAHEDVNKVAQ